MFFLHVYRLKTLITTAVFLFLGLSVIVFPQAVFLAALRGLKIWWEIVVPALLPFFIISHIFMGLGIVNFLGVILEPVMRPLFNVPGSGAFVMTMGYTSGAPISAILTSRLRCQGEITRTEGERLICFTSNASPLFMLGAVAVGMLQNPDLGPLLAGTHYGANFILGLLFRFYGRRRPSTPQSSYSLLLLPARAWRAMVHSQQRDGRSIGQLLADAVNHSFQTLLTIGGFVILFSVIIQVVTITGLLKPITKILMLLCTPLDLGPEAASALAGGLFEMTMGTKLASEAYLPIKEQLVAISLIMGWAGLSILGQVAAMISSTDMSLKPFVIARILHGFLAAILVKLCYGPAQPVLALLSGYTVAIPRSSWLILWLSNTLFALVLMFAMLSLTGLGFAVYRVLRPKRR